jgi:hypothetical protein
MTFRHEFTFTDGYDSREPESRPAGAPSNILGYGSENLLYQGRKGHLEPFKGLTAVNPITGGRTMFNFSDGYASLNDYDPGSGNVEGRGSIFISYGRTMWAVGAGKAFYNGSDLSFAVTSTLSFRKLASGVYTGTTYSAGLAQPSAPTVAARTASFGAGLTGLLNGTYSVKITRIRSTSGAESIASLPSATISVTNGTIRITFPSLDSNGQDKWGIYVTQAGFGVTGPYFLWKEINDTDLSTIDSVARSYETEWADGGVLPILAPTDNYQPPACTHAVQLEDVTNAIGCYGDSVSGISSTNPGNAIAPSLPGFPEAYPPDQLLFLPESPVHVMTRPFQRYAYILMKNSVAALTYTGGEPAVSLEIIWDNIGCSAPHQAVDINGRLYAYAGGKLVRMGIGGEPEEFGDEIARELSGFTAANVVLGYDTFLKTFCVMHGTKVYPLHRPGEEDEKWGAPLDISGFATGNAHSCVTVNNRLLMTVKNGTTFNLYQFHVGAGSTWKAFSNWTDAGEPIFRKTIQTIASVFQHDNLTHPDVTTKVFGTAQAGSFDNATVLKTITHTIASVAPVAYSPRPARRLIRTRRAFAVQMSAQSTGGDSRPIRVVVEGEVNALV